MAINTCPLHAVGQTPRKSSMCYSCDTSYQFHGIHQVTISATARVVSQGSILSGVMN